MALAVAAIAAGALAALTLGRVMERLLFGVDARDPFTFAAVGAILFAAAFGASAVPALRAIQIDPWPCCAPRSARADRHLRRSSGACEVSAGRMPAVPVPAGQESQPKANCRAAQTCRSRSAPS
jgi:hypothetical protein